MLYTTEPIHMVDEANRLLVLQDIPHRGKLRQGKTLANLEIHYKFAKTLINCLKAIKAGLELANVHYFAKCNLACDLPKFFLTKVSLCIVLYTSHAQSHLTSTVANRNHN